MLPASPQTTTRTCLSRVARCRFDAGIVHHLHWHPLNCSVGALHMVPSRYHLPPRGENTRVVPEPSKHASCSAFEIKLRRPSMPRSLQVRRQRARSLLLQLPDAANTTSRAPTRYFATPEMSKLHRTKACSTLAHSHTFVEFQVCQQCHGSAADHTQYQTLHPDGLDLCVNSSVAVSFSARGALRALAQ